MNLNDADLRDAVVLLVRVRALGERIRTRATYSQELAMTASELLTAADEVLRASAEPGPPHGMAVGTEFVDPRRRELVQDSRRAYQ